ncbi:hypothetical protein BD779DRAFT_1465334 [Infundibulicybe gibba]|nr:hypothetical protein BD779DRAFT_1465334 [Infundibulicybe gibba]
MQQKFDFMQKNGLGARPDHSKEAKLVQVPEKASDAPKRAKPPKASHHSPSSPLGPTKLQAHPGICFGQGRTFRNGCHWPPPLTAPGPSKHPFAMSIDLQNSLKNGAPTFPFKGGGSLVGRRHVDTNTFSHHSNIKGLLPSRERAAIATLQESRRMNGRMYLKKNTKDHITLASIHVMGGINSTSSSELSRATYPQSSNLQIRLPELERGLDPRHKMIRDNPRPIPHFATAHAGAGAALLWGDIISGLFRAPGYLV